MHTGMRAEYCAINDNSARVEIETVIFDLGAPTSHRWSSRGRSIARCAGQGHRSALTGTGPTSCLEVTTSSSSARFSTNPGGASASGVISICAESVRGSMAQRFSPEAEKISAGEAFRLIFRLRFRRTEGAAAAIPTGFAAARKFRLPASGRPREQAGYPRSRSQTFTRASCQLSSAASTVHRWRMTWRCGTRSSTGDLSHTVSRFRTSVGSAVAMPGGSRALPCKGCCRNRSA